MKIKNLQCNSYAHRPTLIMPSFSIRQASSLYELPFMALLLLWSLVGYTKLKLPEPGVQKSHLSEDRFSPLDTARLMPL